MRVGSLFAGIGGFDLAAESLGWSTAWVSEIDPFASAVLAKHFPDARNLGDVTVIDWTQVEPVDVICAGFPCQPHSLAGKRQASGDERDLWSECVRAVGLLRPRYFVGENVSGLLTSEGGRFFNRVVSDLAALGYAVEWGTLSAAECGAPHQRSRIFIVAYPEGERPGEARRLRRDRPEDGTAWQREAVGDRAERGRGTGTGEPVRRAAGGCEGVGDAGSARGSAGLSGPDARDEGHAGQRHDRGRGFLLPDWFDAIPYRGADGTVRLIPAGAVVDSVWDEQRAGAAGRGVREADSTVRAKEGLRPEPSLRALVDGLPDRLAGRDRGGEEAENWSTPNERDWPAPGGDRTGHAQSVAVDASTFGGTGGSLWPVTESEPGRVAKLRAVGNAVVPRWVVEGPFRRILELESLLPTRGPDHG